VIRLSPGAEQQLDDLLFHYEKLERPEAIRNLMAAVRRAATRIELAPEAGLPAPRPYPALARVGRRWLKEGRYWFAYSLTTPPVILAVFHDQAAISRRLLGWKPWKPGRL
jgi:plasmid stabilization system protein ParE